MKYKYIYIYQFYMFTSIVAVLEIRVRNWSAIFWTYVGHFVGFWLLFHWWCTVNLANQNGFCPAICQKMANGQLLLHNFYMHIWIECSIFSVMLLAAYVRSLCVIAMTYHDWFTWCLYPQHKCTIQLIPMSSPITYLSFKENFVGNKHSRNHKYRAIRKLRLNIHTDPSTL